MSYIIFDLEFNQSYNSVKDKINITNGKCPFEIIQIGAVKLNKELQVVSTFNKLVKPEIYKEINPFVREITGITTDKVSSEKNFNEVFEEFINFIKDTSPVLCVWGSSDMRELFRNIKYHKLDTALVPKEYINLQSYASKYLKCAKGICIGLSAAIDLLDIPIKENFHDAFNDAYYTAEVFKKIYSADIKTKIYEPDNNRRFHRENIKKQKIDNYSLIKQFEKMFNREMTEEEQSIIKLAYIMGKTNQFIIDKT